MCAAATKNVDESCVRIGTRIYGGCRKVASFELHGCTLCPFVDFKVVAFDTLADCLLKAKPSKCVDFVSTNAELVLVPWGIHISNLGHEIFPGVEEEHKRDRIVTVSLFSAPQTSRIHETTISAIQKGREGEEHKVF